MAYKSYFEAKNQKMKKFVFTQKKRAKLAANRAD
jgi:hypothetical protein